MAHEVVGGSDRSSKLIDKVPARNIHTSMETRACSNFDLVETSFSSNLQVVKPLIKDIMQN